MFYSPNFEGNSDWVEDSVEIVRGTPQRVMKLHLKDDAEKGITGVAPPTLLNRVIIGPCESPIQIRASIAAAMEQAGIQNAVEKIWMSLIRLRHGY